MFKSLINYYGSEIRVSCEMQVLVLFRCSVKKWSWCFPKHHISPSVLVSPALLSVSLRRCTSSVPHFFSLHSFTWDNGWQTLREATHSALAARRTIPADPAAVAAVITQTWIFFIQSWVCTSMRLGDGKQHRDTSGSLQVVKSFTKVQFGRPAGIVGLAQWKNRIE